MDLGDSLRGPRATPGGDEIRRVSKQKVDVVSKLIRHAKARASQIGHPPSVSAVEELEMTLDAAFADPQAAADTPSGSPHHRVALFGARVHRAQPDIGSPARTKGSGSARDCTSEAHRIAAKRDVDKANHEAEQADAHVEKARQAVKEAAAELTRLKSAEATGGATVQRRSRPGSSSQEEAQQAAVTKGARAPPPVHAVPERAPVTSGASCLEGASRLGGNLVRPKQVRVHWHAGRQNRAMQRWVWIDIGEQGSGRT